MGEPAPTTVLIYYQSKERAREVRSLVSERFPQLSAHAVSTPEQAEALVGQADVIAGWGFPPALLTPRRETAMVPQVRGRRGRHHRGRHAAGPRSAHPHRRPGVRTPHGRVRHRLHAGSHAKYPARLAAAGATPLAAVSHPYAGGQDRGHRRVGDIGQEIVRRTAALDMRVVGWRRTPSPVPGVERVYAGLRRASSLSRRVRLPRHRAAPDAQHAGAV